MRAVLYTRVSKREQAVNGLSLAAQRERLESEAASRGWDDAEVVTERGVSGSVPPEDRPALGPALRSLREGDVLAVAKLDRLSRSTHGFATLVKRARDEGWSIVVLDPALDMTDPHGRAFANMLVVFAEWEWEIISQRIRAGLSQSQKKPGRPKGSPQPPGSRRRPVEPSPQVLAVVKRARRHGESLRGIADALNEAGLKSPRGKQWHAASVRRLIQRIDAAA